MSQPDMPDFLEEDDEVRGQRYVLLSFLSPEKVLAKKDVYFFNEFVKDYEITWKTKNLEKYLAEQILSVRNMLFAQADTFDAEDLSGAALKCREAVKNFSIENVLDGYKTYVLKNKREINATKISEDFEEFLFKNQEHLEDEFFTKNNFQTSIRGLKVRGVYDTALEAEARAKKLQRKDPKFNILIGDVGKWLAWDPSPHQIPNQEYANEELNKLMKMKNDNEEKLDDFYNKNPEVKGAKNVKSVFNMSLEPADDAATKTAIDSAVGSVGTVTEATSALFGSAADLAVARKMERLASATATATDAAATDATATDATPATATEEEAKSTTIDQA